MVLHLLGKKSWNVYNQDNVERVKRDEAEARAREEAAEQRTQDEDAQRRIALLRGEKVEPLSSELESPAEDTWRSSKVDDTYSRRDLKRKRHRGEDDTDRDIRYARQDAEAGQKATKSLLKKGEKDAPLQDHVGNIQLFPAPDKKAIRAGQKNEEAEEEKRKKRQREEYKVTMQFSNAAGFANGMGKPWYASASERNIAQKDETSATAMSRNEMMLAELQGKDVWGNEDHRRKEREQNHISSNDPFAAMQQAQWQLKQSEKDKEAWQRRQQAELDELKRQQRREKERRRREGDEDSLDGFSLHAPAAEKSGDGERRHKHHHHHHHHRSRHRSHEREGDKRHRRRSREREQDGERRSQAA